EAVVGSDEVHARPGFSAAEVELVGRSAKAGRQLLRRRVAPPEVAHVVAKAVVPLSPSGGKPAHLITARAAVPGLGDELNLGQHGILAHRLQKSALRVEAVRLP